MAETRRPFIEEALRLAEENVTSGRGGPFGAVVVKDGRIVAGAEPRHPDRRPDRPRTRWSRSARPAGFSGHSGSRDARSTRVASRARCAWARSTGPGRPALLRGLARRRRGRGLRRLVHLRRGPATGRRALVAHRATRTRRTGCGRSRPGTRGTTASPTESDRPGPGRATVADRAAAAPDAADADQLRLDQVDEIAGRQLRRDRQQLGRQVAAPGRGHGRARHFHGACRPARYSRPGNRWRRPSRCAAAGEAGGIACLVHGAHDHQVGQVEARRGSTTSNSTSLSSLPAARHRDLRVSRPWPAADRRAGSRHLPRHGRALVGVLAHAVGLQAALDLLVGPAPAHVHHAHAVRRGNTGPCGGSRQPGDGPSPRSWPGAS